MKKKISYDGDPQNFNTTRNENHLLDKDATNGQRNVRHFNVMYKENGKLFRKEKETKSVIDIFL